MGNQTMTPDQTICFEKLEFIESLGPAKTLMRKPATEDYVVVVESTFPTESQADKYLKTLAIRYEPGHQYYLTPLKKFVINSSTFCSKQHKCVQVFPYHDYTFEEEIRHRIQQKRPFSQRQVWSVLCSCVLFMAHFTRSQITHLQLSPNDILLDIEGRIKVKPFELSDCHIDYVLHPGFFYAPETLKSLRNRSLWTQNNKASVFTFGMTILSALTLTELNYIYSKEFDMNINQMHRLLMQVQSDQMKQILRKMLKTAPYERISFTELEEMLYAILEQSGLETQEQIQRLEESIYRVNTAVEDGGGDCYGDGGENACGNVFEAVPDAEDLPSLSMSRLNFIDEQVIDQEQNTNDHQQDRGEKVLRERSTNIMYEKINANQLQKSNIRQEAIASSRPIYVIEKHGHGTYQGYKQGQMRHGFGTFHYAEGGHYSGQWKNNKMQGRGALYYGNKQLAYEGQWKADQLHGFGVLYNENPVYITSGIDWQRLDTIQSCWVKYQGNFVADQRHGEGTLFLSNGEYYRGQFKQDLPEGKGLFKTTANKLIKGKWRRGTFQSYYN